MLGFPGGEPDFAIVEAVFDQGLAFGLGPICFPGPADLNGAGGAGVVRRRLKIAEVEIAGDVMAPEVMLKGCPVQDGAQSCFRVSTETAYQREYTNSKKFSKTLRTSPSKGTKRNFKLQLLKRGDQKQTDSIPKSTSTRRCSCQLYGCIHPLLCRFRPE